MPFNPQRDALQDVWHGAAAWRNQIARALGLSPAPSFSVAFVYGDGDGRWVPLVTRRQLLPCCQLYFVSDTEDDTAETVSCIPDPVDAAQLLASVQATTSRGGRIDSGAQTSLSFAAARVPPLALLSTSVSLVTPVCRHYFEGAASSWAGSSSSRFGLTLSRRDDVDERVRNSGRSAAGREAAFAYAMNSEGVATAASSARSHRFRAPLYSPAAGVLPAVSKASDGGLTSDPCQGTCHPTPPALPPSLVKPETERDPCWFRHGYRSVSSAPLRRPGGHRSPLPRRSSSSIFSRQDSEETASQHIIRSLDASDVARWRPRHTDTSLALQDVQGYGGSSILREERERVATRMRMGMEELRGSLREESDRLRRTLTSLR